MGDAGSVEGRRDLAGHLVGDDHDDAHAAARSDVRAVVAVGHRVTELGGRRDRDDLGQGVTVAHRSRRPQARRRGVHHPVGQLHDLSGDAVADRQPGHPAGPAVREVIGDIAPTRRRPRPRRLGEVADDRQRAVERPSGDHLQLHRREILDLVDDDVAVRPDLVGLVDPPAAVRHRTEYVAGVVEQGDVGRRPAHVGDIVGSWSIQRLDLRLVEEVAGGQPQQRSRAEQVVEQLRRSRAPATSARGRRGPREHHAAPGAARQPDTSTDTGRGGKGGEELALDVTAAGVVALEAARRGLDDACRLLDGEAQEAGPERDHEILPQRPLAIADRPVDERRHPRRRP